MEVTVYVISLKKIINTAMLRKTPTTTVVPLSIYQAWNSEGLWEQE